MSVESDISALQNAVSSLQASINNLNASIALLNTSLVEQQQMIDTLKREILEMKLYEWGARENPPVVKGDY